MFILHQIFTHGCWRPQDVINEGDTYLLVVALGQLVYIPDAALLPLPQDGGDRGVKCEQEVDWSALVLGCMDSSL